MFLLLMVLYLPCCTIAQSFSLPDSLQKYNIDPRVDTISLEAKVKAHQRLLAYAKETSNLRLLSKVYLYLGTDYYLVADYPKAMAFFDKAETTSNNTGNKKDLANALLKKGNLQLRLRNSKEAQNYYLQYQQLMKEMGDSLGIGKAYTSIGSCFNMEKKTEKALENYLLALPLLEKFGNDNHIAVVSGNISVSYLNLGQPQKAIPFIEKTLAIDRRQNYQHNIARSMKDLGRAYGEAGNYDKAMIYLDSAITISRQVSDLENVFIAYSWIAEYSAQKGNYKKAFDYFTKYHFLRDSLIGEQTKQRIAELEVKYNLKKKETELLRSQAEIHQLEHEKTKKQLYVWLLLAGLLAAFGLTYKLRKDQQRSKKMHQMKQELLQTKLQQEKLQSFQLREKIGLQQHDLTDLALEISRKNKYAREMLDQLEKLEKETNKEHMPAIRKLKSLATSHFQLDSDREAFSVNIEKVNRAFYKKLEKQFGRLSPNEKELCGLIRLNLSNKDIAAVKGISVNSAKIARYRLRKRLRLTPDDNIVTFLQKL